MDICVYKNIYIYIERERERKNKRKRERYKQGSGQKARDGTNGISTNRVAANFIDFDRGAVLVLPLTKF